MMHSEQRANFRVSTQREGKLRLGKQSYDCAITNESAGGFAVNIKQPLHFERGLRLELFFAGGVTVVKVVRCKINANGTTIGLERLKDLASRRELDDAKWSLLSYVCGWRRQAEGMSLANIAILCVVVVALGWGLVRFTYAMLPSSGRGIETNTAFGNVSATYVVESRRDLAKSFNDYLDRFRNTRSGQLASSNEKVQENFARFVRQRLLASNQAAIALGLTQEQIYKIREAVCNVEKEVATLSQSLKTDESELATVAQSRLVEAEKQSLACLTHDQRLLWATLTCLELPESEKQE